MEITTLLGIIAGLIAVIGAMIFKHISFSVFLNPAAFFVIFVGTVATILNSYPAENLKNIGALFRILFTKRKGISELEVIKLMIELSTLTRKEGLLALEGQMEAIEDPFIRKGLRMVVDGMGEDVISDILAAEIAAMEERHEVNASIFSSAGMYAPTLGVLGAVFGLIAAMAHIDDTEEMAHAIAAAFIATILGIFTGYVLWNPFAKKLKVKSHEEALVKGIIVEGVLSLQKGDSPVLIQEKLISVLPQAKQEKILRELRQE
ncbi:MAG TPA: flagellar motor stator protein MotA [Clostridiales bacterium]|nr:flagellar motor stator protein MotA [Clostridiales bacterium]